MSRITTDPGGVAPADLLVRAAEAEALGRSLLAMAARLRDDARPGPGHAGDPPAGLALREAPPGLAATTRAAFVESRAPDPAHLARTVAGLIALRQRRLRHLGLALAGEAAWDILLALFDARLARRQSTFDQLCAAGGTYPATTRRWITVLAGLGLVEQQGSPTDPRQRLELTRKGERAMADCLSGLEAPLPDDPDR